MKVNTICGEEMLVIWCEEEIGEVLERGLPVPITRSGPVGQWTGSGA